MFLQPRHCLPPPPARGARLRPQGSRAQHAHHGSSTLLYAQVMKAAGALMKAPPTSEAAAEVVALEKMVSEAYKQVRLPPHFHSLHSPPA